MTHDIPVLIVGGGPVGLCAAIFLARHGVRSILVERHPSTTNHPKARGFYKRTMEALRPCAIEPALRAASLPQGAWRFVWMDALTGRELRQVAPAGRDRPGPHSPTYICAASQDSFETELLRHARSYPEIDIRFRTELLAFTQDDHAVAATIRDRPTGTTSNISAAYMIGADGGASTVRHALGIAMQGQSLIGDNVNIHFRAELAPWVAQRRALGYFFARDYTRLLWAGGTDRWIFLRPIRPDRGEKPEDFTHERCIEYVREVVGIPDLPVEIINLLFWTLAADTAERFRTGRVFLAGDAAHRLPPTGGFGANTGIQDVHNLAWKLAFVLHGHAPPTLLDTYEPERKPVAESNIAFSLTNISRAREVMRRMAEGAEGALAAALADQLKHLDSDGQDLGFRYDGAAITPDGTPPPGGDSQTYIPSARPGSRAPHFWLKPKDGTAPISTLDLFEKTFTLLTTPQGTTWHTAARHAASTIGLQLTTHSIGPGGDFEPIEGNWTALYGLAPDGAILIRPDGHVAWRSPVADPSPEPILEAALRNAVGL